jgi:hypothetical protein
MFYGYYDIMLVSVVSEGLVVPNPNINICCKFLPPKAHQAQAGTHTLKGRAGRRKSPIYCNNSMILYIKVFYTAHI